MFKYILFGLENQYEREKLQKQQQNVRAIYNSALRMQAHENVDYCRLTQYTRNVQSAVKKDALLFLFRFFLFVLSLFSDEVAYCVSNTAIASSTSIYQTYIHVTLR